MVTTSSVAVDMFCQTIAQRDYVNVQESADTWDTYTSELCEAIVEAIAARTTAQQDYAKIQAELDRWERKLQVLALNSREDLPSGNACCSSWGNTPLPLCRGTRQQEWLPKTAPDSLHQALLSRNACRDKARHLKALEDKYSVQISTLESQLAFWKNQI